MGLKNMLFYLFLNFGWAKKKKNLTMVYKVQDWLLFGLGEKFTNKKAKIFIERKKNRAWMINKIGT